MKIQKPNIYNAVKAAAFQAKDRVLNPTTKVIPNKKMIVPKWRYNGPAEN